MDTIMYLLDPKDPQTMVSITKNHSQLITLTYDKATYNILKMNEFDDCDKANDELAVSFFPLIGR